MFDLPDWFSEFRPHQLVAVSQIVSEFRKGKNVVLLDAPTGSGKTLIAEAVRQTLAYGHDNYKTLYICVTKTLQDQFLRDYEYARVLKGRSNYPTEIDPMGIGVTAADCMGERCKFCPSLCPYQQAKFEAKTAPISVLNMAYALNEFKGMNSVFRGANFKVVDECDVTEGMLLSQASIYISRRAATRLGLRPPEKKTVSSAWLPWAQNARRVVGHIIEDSPRVYGSDARAVRERRWKKYVSGLFGKLVRLEADLTESEELGEQSWIYSGYESDAIEFKPITVGDFGREGLWNFGGKWLLMSGSIISDVVLANDIGLEPNEYASVKVDYSFDPKRRPIVIDPVGSMKRAQIEVTTPKMVMRILEILREHVGERVLLHTHSYKLASEIVDYLNGMPEVRDRRIVTYTNSAEREFALSEYTSEHNPDAVMIASSMDRGVDLPYDLCRVQVICKAPFPNLGDKLVSARTYGTKGGSLWYAVQTVRAIVQMTGRGMRHSDDEVVTYVLDDDVRRLIRKNKRLFPQWWLDALVTP